MISPISHKPVMVVKIGGRTLDQRGMLDQLADEIKALEGVWSVIVHGGGTEIGKYLQRLGKAFTFVQGLRVTDADMVEVVEMVLSGKINKRIVGVLWQHGVKAIGASGKDWGLLRAEKLKQDGVDLGYVGKIVAVNPALLRCCFANQVVPVISPISYGAGGETYNVNADHAAFEVARAMASEELVFVSDVEGIRRANGERLGPISTTTIETLIEQGEITGGMIPKALAAVAAVKGGVKRARIIGWNGPGTLTGELASAGSYGTVVE